jgi:hypothetical protein
MIQIELIDPFFGLTGQSALIASLSSRSPSWDLGLNPTLNHWHSGINPLLNQVFVHTIWLWNETRVKNVSMGGLKGLVFWGPGCQNNARLTNADILRLTGAGIL